MRVLIFSIIVLMFANVYAADQWDKDEPLGTRNAADIDSYIQTNNEALDRLNINYRQGCEVVTDTASQIKVLAGSIAIPDSTPDVVRWRRNTSDTTVTWSDIDTGSEANSTQYYVYATADVDETGFRIVISTNSSAPSGYTYYRKIGYFYNDSSGDIVDVGNVGVRNIISVTGSTDITTTSTSYTDMDDMIIHYVATGKPVKVTFSAPMYLNNSGYIYTSIDVDGTSKIVGCMAGSASYTQMKQVTVVWEGVLSSGTHTIKVQWKVSASTASQGGSTYGERILIAEEG